MKAGTEKAFEPVRVKAVPVYFKVEQIGGEWVTRQWVYLTKSEAAQLLHVSERTVYEYANRLQNPLPAFRLPGGRSLLFKPDDIERWLEQTQDVGI